MTKPYWHRQTQAQPLFPDLLWSRPENRSLAGKLLIVGGNLHGFSAPAEAYEQASRAGAGAVRVILPDSLQKTVGKVFEAGEYAPANPSGSFGQGALTELLSFGSWADGILLAGDFGHNSETAMLLESFVARYKGQLTLTADTVDYVITNPLPMLNRPDTTLVISFAQLQKIGMQAHFTSAFTSDMDLLRFVDTLHAFSEAFSAAYIVKRLDTIFVASKEQISSTPTSDNTAWPVKAAARAAVWQMQNPASPFEALTTSLINQDF